MTLHKKRGLMAPFFMADGCGSRYPVWVALDMLVLGYRAPDEQQDDGTDYGGSEGR